MSPSEAFPGLMTFRQHPLPAAVTPPVMEMPPRIPRKTTKHACHKKALADSTDSQGKAPTDFTENTKHTYYEKVTQIF